MDGKERCFEEGVCRENDDAYRGAKKELVRVRESDKRPCGGSYKEHEDNPIGYAGLCHNVQEEVVGINGSAVVGIRLDEKRKISYTDTKPGMENSGLQERRVKTFLFGIDQTRRVRPHRPLTFHRSNLCAASKSLWKIMPGAQTRTSSEPQRDFLASSALGPNCRPS